jgi:hypothetical protein
MHFVVYEKSLRSLEGFHLFLSLDTSNMLAPARGNFRASWASES